MILTILHRKIIWLQKIHVSKSLRHTDIQGWLKKTCTATGGRLKLSQFQLWIKPIHNRYQSRFQYKQISYKPKARIICIITTKTDSVMQQTEHTLTLKTQFKETQTWHQYIYTFSTVHLSMSEPLWISSMPLNLQKHSTKWIIYSILVEISEWKHEHRTYMLAVTSTASVHSHARKLATDGLWGAVNSPSLSPGRNLREEAQSA